MLRKVAILVTLFSLTTVSAGAGELPGTLIPQSVKNEAEATNRKDQPGLMVVAASDKPDAGTTDTVAQKETKSRPSCTLGEFFDIHFGGYRWLWWVGAAGVLTAIHVAH